MNPVGGRALSDGEERASPPPGEPAVGVRPALRAAVVYAALGALWILISDRLVHLLVRDPDTRSLVQTIKGWAFVAVTAALAFELVRGAVRERARMEGELVRLDRTLRAIRACNQAMLRIRDERELLREVCRVVVEEGGYRMAWVGYRRDDERRTVEPVAWAGYEAGYLSSIDLTWADEPRGRGPTGTAIRTREPVVAQRIAEDPRMEPWRRLARERGYGSSIALPLVIDGEVLGALNIYAALPDAFSGEEVELLREMSEDLAFGIGAVRARAERERLLERLEALVEIDREILGAGSVERVAEIAVQRARRLVGADRASLLALEPGGETMRVLAIDPPPDPGAIGRVVPVGALVADPGDLRRPWFFASDLPTRPGRTPEQEAAWRDVRGGIGVPLRVADEVLGVLGVVSREEGIMTEENARALRDLADGVALALQQQRLREEIERQAAELERRVEERTAELRERNAELDAFSSSVSHDLRAPLRAVRGFARALLEDHAAGLDPTGRAFAERIVRVAERMDRLMADLLAYSRLGREDLTLARVPLGPVVGEVLELLRADIEASRATVEVVPHLPAVAADPRVLTQIVLNLVGNALKFVEPGVAPRVRIAATEREGWVRLEVSDNGIGIPPEHRERVFRPLERLHGMDRYPGTGIGLAIVRRGVERMGGRCGVESEPGRGSTFWVELRSPPAQVEAAPAEAT